MTTNDQIEIQQTIKRHPLIVRCEDRLQAARDFADRVKLRESLEECLEQLTGPYFSRETRTTLYSDFAPYSFGFDKEYLQDGTWKMAYNGGLIYHGPHDNGGDGGGPTFSVNLTPHSGWNIHT